MSKNDKNITYQKGKLFPNLDFQNLNREIETTTEKNFKPPATKKIIQQKYSLNPTVSKDIQKLQAQQPPLPLQKMNSNLGFNFNTFKPSYLVNFNNEESKKGPSNENNFILDSSNNSFDLRTKNKEINEVSNFKNNIPSEFNTLNEEIYPKSLLDNQQIQIDQIGTVELNKVGSDINLTHISSSHNEKPVNNFNFRVIDSNKDDENNKCDVELITSLISANNNKKATLHSESVITNLGDKPIPSLKDKNRNIRKIEMTNKYILNTDRENDNTKVNTSLLKGKIVDKPEENVKVDSELERLLLLEEKNKEDWKNIRPNEVIQEKIRFNNTANMNNINTFPISKENLQSTSESPENKNLKRRIFNDVEVSSNEYMQVISQAKEKLKNNLENIIDFDIICNRKNTLREITNTFSINLNAKRKNYKFTIENQNYFDIFRKEKSSYIIEKINYFHLSDTNYKFQFFKKCSNINLNYIHEKNFLKRCEVISANDLYVKGEKRIYKDNNTSLFNIELLAVNKLNFIKNCKIENNVNTISVQRTKLFLQNAGYYNCINFELFKTKESSFTHLLISEASILNFNRKKVTQLEINHLDINIFPPSLFKYKQFIKNNTTQNISIDYILKRKINLSVENNKTFELISQNVFIPYTYEKINDIHVPPKKKQELIISKINELIIESEIKEANIISDSLNVFYLPVQKKYSITTNNYFDIYQYKKTDFHLNKENSFIIPSFKKYVPNEVSSLSINIIHQKKPVSVHKDVCLQIIAPKKEKVFEFTKTYYLHFKPKEKVYYPDSKVQDFLLIAPKKLDFFSIENTSHKITQRLSSFREINLQSVLDLMIPCKPKQINRIENLDLFLIENKKKNIFTVESSAIFIKSKEKIPNKQCVNGLFTIEMTPKRHEFKKDVISITLECKKKVIIERKSEENFSINSSTKKRLFSLESKVNNLNFSPRYPYLKFKNISTNNNTSFNIVSSLKIIPNIIETTQFSINKDHKRNKDEDSRRNRFTNTILRLEEADSFSIKTLDKSKYISWKKNVHTLPPKEEIIVFVSNQEEIRIDKYKEDYYTSKLTKKNGTKEGKNGSLHFYKNNIVDYDFEEDDNLDKSPSRNDLDTKANQSRLKTKENDKITFKPTYEDIKETLPQSIEQKMNSKRAVNDAIYANVETIKNSSDSNSQNNDLTNHIYKSLNKQKLKKVNSQNGQENDYVHEFNINSNNTHEEKENEGSNINMYEINEESNLKPSKNPGSEKLNRGESSINLPMEFNYNIIENKSKYITSKNKQLNHISEVQSIDYNVSLQDHKGERKSVSGSANLNEMKKGIEEENILMDGRNSEPTIFTFNNFKQEEKLASPCFINKLECDININELAGSYNYDDENNSLYNTVKIVGDGVKGKGDNFNYKEKSKTFERNMYFKELTNTYDSSPVSKIDNMKYDKPKNLKRITSLKDRLNNIVTSKKDGKDMLMSNKHAKYKEEFERIIDQDDISDERVLPSLESVFDKERNENQKLPRMFSDINVNNKKNNISNLSKQTQLKITNSLESLLKNDFDLKSNFSGFKKNFPIESSQIFLEEKDNHHTNFRNFQHNLKDLSTVKTNMASKKSPAWNLDISILEKNLPRIAPKNEFNLSSPVLNQNLSKMFNSSKANDKQGNRESSVQTLKKMINQEKSQLQCSVNDPYKSRLDITKKPLIDISSCIYEESSLRNYRFKKDVIHPANYINIFKK